MKFIKQAIFCTCPLPYTLTEHSGSQVLGNKMKHQVLFYNDTELDDLLFGTGLKTGLLRIFYIFLFKEKDFLLHIDSFCCLQN